MQEGNQNKGQVQLQVQPEPTNTTAQGFTGPASESNKGPTVVNNSLMIEEERFECNSSPRPYRKVLAQPVQKQFPKPAKALYDSNEEISWRSIKAPTGAGTFMFIWTQRKKKIPITQAQIFDQKYKLSSNFR